MRKPWIYQCSLAGVVSSQIPFSFAPHAEPLASAPAELSVAAAAAVEAAAVGQQ